MKKRYEVEEKFLNIVETTLWYKVKANVGCVAYVHPELDRPKDDDVGRDDTDADSFHETLESRVLGYYSWNCLKIYNRTLDSPWSTQMSLNVTFGGQYDKFANIILEFCFSLSIFHFDKTLEECSLIYAATLE